MTDGKFNFLITCDVMKRSFSRSSFQNYRKEHTITQGSEDELDMHEAKPASGSNTSWGALARKYWPQYLGVFGTVVLLGVSEKLEPYHHVVYHKSDLEYWKYSYPLRSDQVPPWAVPLIALFGPASIILLFYFFGKISRVEAHHSLLLAVGCVATNGVVTNFIKVGVGRHRPDFVARCWPGDVVPKFKLDGRPDCADNAVNPDEGRKSFPSGHTSWSTAGLGYLTFWLMGKLRCFDGSAQPMRFVGSLLPLLGAVWIGLTRLQDYWHHVEDVAAGFVLGLTMAYCFYRQIYPAIISVNAGILLVARPTPSASNGSFNFAMPALPLCDEEESGSAHERADSRV